MGVKNQKESKTNSEAGNPQYHLASFLRVLNFFPAQLLLSLQAICSDEETSDDSYIEVEQDHKINRAKHFFETCLYSNVLI